MRSSILLTGALAASALAAPRQLVNRDVCKHDSCLDALLAYLPIKADFCLDFTAGLCGNEISGFLDIEVNSACSCLSEVTATATIPAVSPPTVNPTSDVAPIVTAATSIRKCKGKAPTAAITAPTVAITAPAISVPDVSIPAITAPAISVPALSVPDVSIPAITAPALSVSDVSIPAISVPALSVPDVSIPAISVPALSVPAISVPHVSVPDVTLGAPVPTGTSGWSIGGGVSGGVSGGAGGIGGGVSGGAGGEISGGSGSIGGGVSGGVSGGAGGKANATCAAPKLSGGNFGIEGSLSANAGMWLDSLTGSCGAQVFAGAGAHISRDMSASASVSAGLDLSGLSSILSGLIGAGTNFLQVTAHDLTSTQSVCQKVTLCKGGKYTVSVNAAADAGADVVLQFTAGAGITSDAHTLKAGSSMSANGKISFDFTWNSDLLEVPICILTTIAHDLQSVGLAGFDIVAAAL